MSLPGKRSRVGARQLASAVLVAVLLASCGGSGGVKPSAYVHSMCSALGNWKNDVQRAGTKLQTTGAANAARTVAKQDYRRFVAALLTATQHAATALQSAGTPDVKNGKQIASSLAGAFGAASRRLAQANTQAATIPTGSATSFQLGASSVTAQIRSALQGIAGVSPSQSAPLRAAALKEPACQVLRG